MGLRFMLMSIANDFFAPIRLKCFVQRVCITCKSQLTSLRGGCRGGCRDVTMCAALLRRFGLDLITSERAAGSLFRQGTSC